MALVMSPSMTCAMRCPALGYPRPAALAPSTGTAGSRTPCLVGDDAVDADLTSAWKRREMRAQRLPLDGSSWWRPSPDWIWRGLEEGGDDHGKSPREETEGGSEIVLLFRDGRCLLLLNAGPNQSSHTHIMCAGSYFSLYPTLELL